MTHPRLTHPRVLIVGFTVGGGKAGKREQKTKTVDATFVWSENSRRVYAFEQYAVGSPKAVFKGNARRRRERQRVLLALLRALGHKTVRVPSHLACELPQLTGKRRRWITVKVPHKKR